MRTPDEIQTTIDKLIADGWTFSLDCYGPGRWDVKLSNDDFYVSGKGDTSVAAIAQALESVADILKQVKEMAE